MNSEPSSSIKGDRCAARQRSEGLVLTCKLRQGVWVFTVPVSLSLAEMASMAPTSGGQYHWTSEVSAVAPGTEKAADSEDSSRRPAAKSS